MSYEMFVVLRAAIDNSRKRQKDVIVRFLEGVSRCFPQRRERRAARHTRKGGIRFRTDVLRALSKPLNSGYSYACRC